VTKNDNCHCAVTTKVAVKVMGKNACLSVLLTLEPVNQTSGQAKC